MGLTVLSVAYSLGVVGPDAAGGAEQVLALLDEGLTRAGHQSIVVAPEGSVTAGVLLPTLAVEGPLDDAIRQLAWRAQMDAIRRALAAWPIDLVHMHGLDFDAVLPPAGVPVLSTLHLPPTWYAPGALRPTRPGTWIHAVSRTQHEALPRGPHVLPPIPNGIAAADALTENENADQPDDLGVSREGALYLGRICPEKGVHLAIDAARRAGLPIAVAGAVFGYRAHQDYFETEVVPRLGAGAAFIGPIGRAEKFRRLRSARCLLVPSLVAETSSLVAMEALASGTPVIAFGAGALPEIIEDGRTGFLVQDSAEMARAIGRLTAISPAVCRAAARDRFGANRMIEAYLRTYQQIRRTPSTAAAPAI
jgi:glycosyltransferase involved in cell wall biosynthesis